MSKKYSQHPLLIPIAGLLSGAVLIGFAFFIFVYAQIFGAGPLSENGQPREVHFKQGLSVSGMAKELEESHIIHSAKLFKIITKLRGGDKKFQAGTYEFASGESMIKVYEKIVAGDVLKLTVTVPEGRTSRQVVAILAAVPDLVGDVDVPPEGSILPETYAYERGETRQAVLDRMLKAGRDTIDELWLQRDDNLPVKSKEQAIILASIVEKETGLKGERPRVAAVFINRLRKGMRLDSDPTVIYGVSHGEPLGRGLTRTELDRETPWNTYKISGLPITPIANPGRAALEATLHPANTEDLFFVADGTGGHVFAVSYDQHLENVARWRQIERNNLNNESVSDSASNSEKSAISLTSSEIQNKSALRQ